MELTIDAVARAVGREPADVRAENLVPAGAMPYTNVTGKHYDSGDYPASVAGARRMIGLDAVRARQGRSLPPPGGAARLDARACAPEPLPTASRPGRLGWIPRTHTRTMLNGPRRVSRRLDAMSARQGAREPDGRLIGIGFSTFTEQTAHGTRVFGACRSCPATSRRR